jgi:hypothetical protein
LVNNASRFEVPKNYLVRNSNVHYNEIFSLLNLEERASFTPLDEGTEEVYDSSNDPDDSRPNVDSQEQDTSNRYFIFGFTIVTNLFNKPFPTASHSF